MSRLSTLRESAGFAGPDGLELLAARVGRSVSWLRRVDCGYRPPEVSARRLASVLECDPLVFVQRDSSGRSGGRSRGGCVSRSGGSKAR